MSNLANIEELIGNLPVSKRCVQFLYFDDVEDHHEELRGKWLTTINGGFYGAAESPLAALQFSIEEMQREQEV